MGVRSLVLLALAASLGGCAKAEESSPKSGNDRSAPVTLDRAQTGSPERVVLTLFRYVQLGSSQVALDQYDPNVVEDLGAANVASALASQEGALQEAQIGEFMREPTRLGTLISLLVTPRGGKPTRYTFILRQREGRWVIVFDNLLESGLSYLARIESKLPPGSPGADQTAAGRYRSLSLGIDQLDGSAE